MPTEKPIDPKARRARLIGPRAPNAENQTGDSVADSVRAKFPDVRIVGVSPITGFVTLDLSKASPRSKRMLRDGEGPSSYTLYDEPGKPVTLQVNVPQDKSKRRK